MSRVQLIDSSTAPLPARRYFEKGDPGPIVAALAQVPELLDVAAPFISLVLGPIALAIRTKELVILRTSALMHCRYCTQSHAYVALNEGFPPQVVKALMSGPGCEFVDDPAEVALLKWVDSVVSGDQSQASGATTQLSKHFDDAALVELTALLGATMMLNVFCTTLELPTSAAALQGLREAGLS